MSKFEVMEKPTQGAVLKVVGVGGCGGNAINHMIEEGMTAAEYVAINTDAQDLHKSRAETTVQIGTTLTRGLGAGAKPDVGRAAAEEDRERIVEVLSGADMVFIAAGMGGGTGTGAAPIVAEVAKELDILTVSVVTRPFVFEGRRMKLAQEGIENLSRHTDALIIVPNEKLLDLDPDITQLEAFRRANGVLYNAVAGIAEVIKEPGQINCDFADVRTVMSELGQAMMGSGVASGADRARAAVDAAISCPLLEGSGINGARGIIINITCSSSLKMSEVREIQEPIRERVDEDANIIVGTVMREDMGDELRVTVIATGLGAVAGSQSARNLRVVETRATGTDSAGAPNYSEYDRPSVFRPRPARRGAGAAQAAAPQQGDLNFPTFLRRQAD